MKAYLRAKKVFDINTSKVILLDTYKNSMTTTPPRTRGHPYISLMQELFVNPEQ